MFDLVTTLLFLLAGVVLVPLGVFVVEVGLSLVARHSRDAAPDLEAPGPRTAVLIPAHNESLVIGHTLERLLPTLGPRDRVLIVADNCTDDTAPLATARGARVVERCDPARRGKAYALDCGLEALRADPPEVVVVLDADCDVEPHTVPTIARRAAATGRPVQALNLSEASSDGHVQVISELGFRFKNSVRPLGLRVLGLPCHLMGTGMALPWSIARRLSLAGDHLAEDMQLGVDLAVAGTPAVFCPEVRVTSRFPQQRAAWVSQRTRWEQGHLRTLLRHAPRLLVHAVRRGRIDLLVLALDLLVPPLSLLILTWLAATALCAAAWIGGASSGPLIALAIGGVATTVAVLAGWAVHCRERVPLRTLAGIPAYILRKVPIYVSFFLAKGERRWLRTEREAPVVTQPKAS
jgi:cellulose synthase/poly-beta-1,6-N-acetylglucosamine synthase-like glycosyltransferase